ncbi:MAG: hypothetical protein IT285_09510 [Bdellovibrionales bacterium]|nr:hypothetical protein [Bdellovibrionales bacterium]
MNRTFVSLLFGVALPVACAVIPNASASSALFCGQDAKRDLVSGDCGSSGESASDLLSMMTTAQELACLVESQGDRPLRGPIGEAAIRARVAQQEPPEGAGPPIGDPGHAGAGDGDGDGGDPELGWEE